MPSSFVPETSFLNGPRTTVDYDGSLTSVLAYASLKTVTSSDPAVGGNRKVPHPWHYTVSQYNTPHGEMLYARILPDYHRYKKVDGVLPVPAGDFTIDYSYTGIAKNKCLAKVIEGLKSSALNLATTLGEGRTTIQMLGGIVTRAQLVQRRMKTAYIRRLIAEGKKQARRANKPYDWRDPVAAVGGAQLYYALGVAPLLADVEAFRQHALTGATDKLVIPFRQRASHRVSNSVTSTVSYEGLTIDKVETLDVTERTQLGGNFVIGDLHKFENWRAGLTVRPSLLWELLTLSWLIDYFLNIGQYLALWEATCYDNGFVITEAYQTDSTLIVKHILLDGYRWPVGYGDFLTDIKSGEGQTIKTLNRILLGGTLPIPDLPRLKLPKASTQLLNVAALLSQLLK